MEILLMKFGFFMIFQLHIDGKSTSFPGRVAFQLPFANSQAVSQAKPLSHA